MTNILRLEAAFVPSDAMNAEGVACELNSVLLYHEIHARRCKVEFRPTTTYFELSLPPNVLFSKAVEVTTRFIRHKFGHEFEINEAS